ncbi:hypothetical protein AMECASPLE_036822 [Ameca splendens]|uniref:Uncharacterized protein n=1 Tax=Ameca splendens TaxID=208324 RepID=A0ABV0XKT8_9TELE
MVCPAGSGDFYRKAVLVRIGRNWVSRLGEPWSRCETTASPSTFSRNLIRLSRVERRSWRQNAHASGQRSTSVNNPETDGTSLMLVLLMKREAGPLRTGMNRRLLLRLH